MPADHPIPGRRAAAAARVLATLAAAGAVAAGVAASAQPADDGAADAEARDGQAADAHASRVPVTEDQRCLALSMYWEARGEGPEGMRAVGSVVLNRVASEDFPGAPCEVVFDGGETPPCQFSWWCDGRSDVPRESEPWQAALALAGEMLADGGEDPTHGALYFHNAALASPWRIERTRTARIADHIYYR